ncbi:MAG: hypothetical protein AUK44_01650 [Porphyromonadaceae bacterium CG2_30_38_12]|nr:MAG: hypothetical protein AUK44_01650 [Porphyromonadaceae bacterium CG2_30_38_12]
MNNYVSDFNFLCYPLAQLFKAGGGENGGEIIRSMKLISYRSFTQSYYDGKLINSQKSLRNHNSNVCDFRCVYRK